MQRFPPGVRSTVVVKTEEVEERRDRIVSFISRNPGLCGAEVRRSLRIKVDTFSNDIARLGTEGRVVWTKGLNNRRLYYVDDPDG